MTDPTNNSPLAESHRQPRTVAVVPCYNHGATVGRVVHDVKQYLRDIIVVNDGSTDNTAEVLRSEEGVTLIDFPANRGKGEALKAAFARARELGYSHAITIDADGQHLAQDIPLFVDKIAASPDVLWIGSRDLQVGDVAQPGRSRFGRDFATFWFRFHTGKLVDDTQCGFRAYPLHAIADLKCPGSRYEYEIEVLVRAQWNGTQVRSIPIHLLYFAKEERVSHFRPLIDFSRIGRVNSRFSFIRILTPWETMGIPGTKWTEKAAHLLKRELTAHTSPKRAASSLAFGVFMGIFPIYGIQVVTALGLSFPLRLNRPLVGIGAGISTPPLLFGIAVVAVGIGSAVIPAHWTPVVQHALEAFLSYSGPLHELAKPVLDAVVKYGAAFVIGSVCLAVLAAPVTYLVSLPMFRRLAARRGEGVAS